MPARSRGSSRADVAQRAGVSPPTVSVVLNGRADDIGVAQATQRRVLEAARALRYVPNSAARAMRGQRHLTIGLIARRPPATLQVPIFEDFAMGVMTRAADHAHNVKFLPPAGDDDDDYDVLRALRDAQVDGILVYDLTSIFRSLVDWRVSAVFVGRGPPSGDLLCERSDGVTIDEEPGLRAAARHVRPREHQHVGVVTGPSATTLPRVAAFVDELGAARTHPLSVAHLQAENWFPGGGFHATTALFHQAPQTSLLHVGNDAMAIGALRALHEAGREVPTDVEVIGFGDFSASAYLQPPLTTVRWPLSDLGIRAVDKLLAQIGVLSTDEPDDPVETSGWHAMLPTEFVARASTQ